MDEATIARVRSFNRVVTQRVGALDDRYLSRDRPLGEARLLWEIGEESCELRVLRARLGLDSGYLSRLLRWLEGAGLVTVSASEADRGVRTARLTSAGMRERAVLDRRSDELARSFLAPLGEAKRERLVAALAEAERLLSAGLVEIEEVAAADPVAQRCLSAYGQELQRRFEGGFDPAVVAAGLPELQPPAGLFVVATLRGEPVACGGLKLPEGKPAEVKRMWVADSARGLGIGRRLLTDLEGRAAAHGRRAIRLETNRALTEAIALYRSAGYREVGAYNDERYAHLWFEKPLEPVRG